MLALALVLVVPAAASAKTSKTDKAQNKALKTLKKNLKAATKSLNVLKTTVTDQGKTLTALDTSVKGVDARLKVIEGAAPTIISGLQGLKTQATSTEYGVAQVFIGATPLAGAFLVTPDIPDAVQQAQTSGQFIAAGAGTVHVQVAVRSAESDGTGSSLPAAHCRVTAQGSGGSTTTSKPNPGVGGAPVWPIDTKSAETSTDPANAGFPFGPKTNGADADVLTELTDISGGGNAVAPLGAGTEAASSGAGQVITVQLSCVDISASSSDPSA